MCTLKSNVNDRVEHHIFVPAEVDGKRVQMRFLSTPTGESPLYKHFLDKVQRQQPPVVEGVVSA